MRNLKNNDQTVNNSLSPKSFIFLDLRVPEFDQDSKSGFLPMTVIFNKEELDDPNVKLILIYFSYLIF